MKQMCPQFVLPSFKRKGKCIIGPTMVQAVDRMRGFCHNSLRSYGAYAYVSSFYIHGLQSSSGFFVECLVGVDLIHSYHNIIGRIQRVIPRHTGGPVPLRCL